MAMVGSGCVRNPSPGDQRLGISLVSQWLRSRFEARAAARPAVKFRRVGARVKRRDPRPTRNLAPPGPLPHSMRRFDSAISGAWTQREPNHSIGMKQRRIDCRQAEMLRADRKPDPGQGTEHPSKRRNDAPNRWRWITSIRNSRLKEVISFKLTRHRLLGLACGPECGSRAGRIIGDPGGKDDHDKRPEHKLTEAAQHHRRRGCRFALVPRNLRQYLAISVEFLG